MNVDTTPKKKKSKTIFSLIFLILNIVLILVIGLRETEGSTMLSFKEVLSVWQENYIFLIYGLMAFALAIIIEAAAMLVLIYNETKKIKIGLAFKVAIFGRYYDYITPLGSGGQGFQIYYLVKGDVPGSNSSAIVFIHFFMNQLAFLIFSILSMIFFFPLLNDTFLTTISPTTLKIMIICGALFAFVGPLIFLLFSVFPKLSRKITFGVISFLKKIHIFKDVESKKEKVDSFIKHYVSSLKHFSKKYVVLIISFICSCIFQLALTSIMYFVVRSCGITTFSFFEMIALAFFTYCAVAFIPTPGNSGAAEIMFTTIFVSISSSVKFWGMLLWRFNCYYMFLIVGIVLLIAQFIRAAVRNKGNATTNTTDDPDNAVDKEEDIPSETL